MGLLSRDGTTSLETIPEAGHRVHVARRRCRRESKNEGKDCIATRRNEEEQIDGEAGRTHNLEYVGEQLATV